MSEIEFKEIITDLNYEVKQRSPPINIGITRILKKKIADLSPEEAQIKREYMAKYYKPVKEPFDEFKKRVTTEELKKKKAMIVQIINSIQDDDDRNMFVKSLVKKLNKLNEE
jgi:hypothetical protein